MALKQTDSSIDMLNGSLADKIIFFALPLAASSILQQLFNSADTAVVGRFASSEAMAAVGANAPVINLLVNLFIGLSVGSNVLVAASIGTGEHERIRKAVHTTISLALICGILLIFIGQAAAAPILRAIGTPDNVLPISVLYLRIYFAGMPFIMLYNFGAAILRSRGDSRLPMIALIISGIINVLLNLFFVIACGMSADGVALATALSNGISAFIIIRALMKAEDPFRLIPAKLSVDLPCLKKIAAVGIPAGIQGIVFSLSNVFIQSAINSFGSAAMAGSSAALNFEYIGYFMVNSFNQAGVTFTGQNFAAKQYKRCDRISFYCFIFGAASCEALAVIFFVLRAPVMGIFSTDPEVIRFGMIRMAHVLLFQGIACSYEIFGSILRGMGHSMTPAALTIFGTCLLRIVWLLTVHAHFLEYGMLLNVYPVSWVVTGIMVTTAYLFIRKKSFAAQN